MARKTKDCRMCGMPLKNLNDDFCSLEHADGWNSQKKTIKDFEDLK